MAYVLKVDGTQEKIATPISIEKAQEVVGGYVERIKLGAGFIMLCNEDGKLEGKPVNRTATLMLAGGTVVGDVIVCINKRESKGWL